MNLSDLNANCLFSTLVFLHARGITAVSCTNQYFRTQVDGQESYLWRRLEECDPYRNIVLDANQTPPSALETPKSRCVYIDSLVTGYRKAHAKSTLNEEYLALIASMMSSSVARIRDAVLLRGWDPALVEKYMEIAANESPANGLPDMLCSIFVTGPKRSGISTLVDRYAHDLYPGRGTGLNVRVVWAWRERIGALMSDDGSGDDLVIKAVITDRQASAKMSPLSGNYFNKPNAALLVTVNLRSKKGLQESREELVKLQRIARQMWPHIPRVLVGTKADEIKARKVSREDAIALANEFSCHYVETSALTKSCVEHAFMLAISTLYNQLFASD